MTRAGGVVTRCVEHALSFRPLVPGELEPGHARTLPLHRALATPVGAPAFPYLAHDPLAELVAGPGESEGGVGMETLEVLTTARAGDPYGELGPRLRCSASARSRLAPSSCVLLGLARVALDSSLGFDAGDAGHEPGAGQIEGGREGLPVSSERRLFRNRRKAVRTARRNPPEWAGRPAELP